MITGHAIDEACRNISALDLDRVSRATVERAQTTLADTVAVAVAGHRSSAMSSLVAVDVTDGLVSRGPAGTAGHVASVWGVGTAHPLHAAWLNATAGTFLELDEGMRPTGHPAMHVAPAVIAAAERNGSSGRALLRAFVVGYEVAARLFRSVRTRPTVHPHGHIGGIGAAVGVALLADVDPVEAARVAGTTPIAATWQACYDGATARNGYTGHSAASGVRAVDMARAGFRGSSDAMALVLGEFFGMTGQSSLRVDSTLDHDSLAIMNNYFKVHSACALTHTGLEAALGLAGTGLDPADVDHVLVETVAVGRKVNVGEATDELSGRFSLPYAVATALITGRTDADAFEFKPEVAELARRVDVRVDPLLERQWPAKATTRVTVTTSAGTFSRLVENAKGHPSRPLSAAEHRAKFDALVGDDALAASWWDRFASLSDIDDCRHLLMEA